MVENGVELDPIVEVLLKERQARNWSQLEVGRMLGHTSGQTIYQWEKGKVVPGITRLRAWAALFGIEIVTRVLVRRGRPRTNFRK